MNMLETNIGFTMKSLRTIKSIILTLMALAILSGCNYKPKESSGIVATNPKDTSYLVTFIELGSVRCIPCQIMQPVMKSIKEKYAGQVNVVFHDVWTEAGAPFGKQYKIGAIPTQIFLDKDGDEYFRHVGFFSEEELVKILNQKGVR